MLRVGESATFGLSFDVTGPSPARALASNLTVGGRTLALKRGGSAGLRPGSWLLVQDDAPYAGSFMTRIAAVAGDDVTLEEASPVAIGAGAGGRIHPYESSPLLEGIVIRDLAFESDGAAAAHKALVIVNRTHRGLIANCRFS